MRRLRRRLLTLPVRETFSNLSTITNNNTREPLTTTGHSREDAGRVVKNHQLYLYNFETKTEMFILLVGISYNK